MEGRIIEDLAVTDSVAEEAGRRNPHAGSDLTEDNRISISRLLEGESIT